MRQFNRLFGIGMPKTGTTSLAEALRILDIPTFHNPTFFRRLEARSIPQFPQIHRGRQWKALTNFGEWSYPILDVNYPRSLFIWTWRFESELLESTERLFRNLRGGENRRTVYGIYGIIKWDREAVCRLIQQQGRMVQKYFRDRHELLTFNVSEGWEPLCTFLDTLSQSVHSHG